MSSNVIQQADYSDAYALGLTQVYEDTLKQHEFTYRTWLREEMVKRLLDTEWSVSGLGQMPEKTFGAVFSTDKIYKGPTKQFSLTAYALGCVLEYEAMKYEIYGIFNGLGEELAKSAANRYQVVAYSLFNNSFSAPNSNYQTHQGENMITTSHTRLDGGTWSNQVTGNPGLSYLGIQDMLINMRRIVNERGIYGILEPRMLVTAPENEFVAREILQSSTRSDQDNPGVINTLRGSLSIHTSPFITSTTAWWLLCNKADTRIKMRIGERPNLKRDSDFRTMNLLMRSYTAFSLAVFDSRGWAGSTG